MSFWRGREELGQSHEAAPASATGRRGAGTWDEKAQPEGLRGKRPFPPRNLSVGDEGGSSGQSKSSGSWRGPFPALSVVPRITEELVSSQQLFSRSRDLTPERGLGVGSRMAQFMTRCLDTSLIYTQT